MNMKVKSITREEMRQFLIDAEGVNYAAEHLAIEGLIDHHDLLWLYDNHRISVPAGIWMLALMHADELPEVVAERMGDPAWWDWCDHGSTVSRHETFLRMMHASAA
jgi:hypothetical protein